MHNILMFDLHLRMLPARHGKLHIHIPAQFRWLFAALAAVTVWVAVYTGIWSPVAVGVLGLSVLGLLYDERWVFNAESGEVHYRIGILFVGRHLVFAMRDIDHFEFCSVTQHGRELSQIILWTVAQEPFMVESQPAAYSGLLRREAKMLADFCGRSLVTDSRGK